MEGVEGGGTRESTVHWILSIFKRPKNTISQKKPEEKDINEKSKKRTQE